MSKTRKVRNLTALSGLKGALLTFSTAGLSSLAGANAAFANGMPTPANLPAGSVGASIPAANIPVPMPGLVPSNIPLPSGQTVPGNLGIPQYRLPTACNGGNCDGNNFQDKNGSVQPLPDYDPVNDSELTIVQIDDRVLLNWQSFDIGEGARVYFDQSGTEAGTNALAINRIFQEAPSQVLGRLDATGRIYLINPNGVVFGEGSQVNVSSIIASSLSLSDKALEGGILIPQGGTEGPTAAFESDGRVYVQDNAGNLVLGEDGNPIRAGVYIAEGAQINTGAQFDDAGALQAELAGGGTASFFGQVVDNAGEVNSPEGQIIMAAGEKIYLQASTRDDELNDKGLRGLLVEVEATRLEDADGNLIGYVAGDVFNRSTGDVSSDFGNVTLAGLAVNQDGRISATTSVGANGSVRLLAKGNNPTVVNDLLGTTETGVIRLGDGSVIDISPDGDALAVDGQTQLPSLVEIVGQDITMEAGSAIVAPGGDVSITATRNPQLVRALDPVPLDPDEDSRIVLEDGSRIDVSGSDATVSVSRNVIEIELRGNELRDSPLQRDGVLRGETVFIDMRDAASLTDPIAIADVDGAVSNVQKDVLERTAEGGNVLLESQGSVDVQSGAVIDVSGGVVTYEAGQVATTWLRTNYGQLVEISDADPNVEYAEIINPVGEVNDPKWGTGKTYTNTITQKSDPGYIEGRDAGSVQIAAPQMAINGQLRGSVTNGEYQIRVETREEFDNRIAQNIELEQAGSAARVMRAFDTQARGGELIIGLPDGQGEAADFRAPSVELGAATGNMLADTFDLNNPLQLTTDYIDNGGFSSTRIYSNGRIDLLAAADALNVGAHAEGGLLLQGQQVFVDRSVVTNGGAISMIAADANVAVSAIDPASQKGVFLADNVSLNASGNWTNENPVSGGRPDDHIVALDGGSINLDAAANSSVLEFGANVEVDANSGAWLSADNTLVRGNGGSVRIAASGPGAGLKTNENLSLSAFGFDRGGSLEIVANQIQIDGGPVATVQDSTNQPFRIADEQFGFDGEFGQGGFESVSIVATGPSNAAGEPLVIKSDADIYAQATQRVLDFSLNQLDDLQTGSDLESHFLGNPAVDQRARSREPVVLAAAQRQCNAGQPWHAGHGEWLQHSH